LRTIRATALDCRVIAGSPFLRMADAFLAVIRVLTAISLAIIFTMCCTV